MICFETLIDVDAEIARVSAAIKATKSEKLKRDYSKYLRKLNKQREGMKWQRNH